MDLIGPAKLFIGVFPKWKRNSLNSVNSEVLKDHWTIKWANLKVVSVIVSSWHWGRALISFTRDSRFEYHHGIRPKYFAKFSTFYRICFGKTRLSTLLSWRGIRVMIHIFILKSRRNYCLSSNIYARWMVLTISCYCYTIHGTKNRKESLKSHDFQLFWLNLHK